MIRILCGDCRDVLKTLPAESVHTVVTSPPYWGLRDYGIPPTIWGSDLACKHEWGEERRLVRMGSFASSTLDHYNNGLNAETIESKNKRRQVDASTGALCRCCGAWRGALGLEPIYQLYVEHMVEVFRAVRRVLRKDGVCWINLGDAYKDKQLLGLPWRVAFALQADGWYLRQDVIWSKPNPMPESITDRCTKAHEYLFMLTKSARYFYDAEAIKEPSIYGGDIKTGLGSTKEFDGELQRTLLRGERIVTNNRNKRSVWEIATAPFNGSHLLADYVGRDGKPYKRSKDCPIHGRHDCRGTQRTVSCDEPLSHSSHHNHDTDSRLGEGHAISPFATPSMSNYTNCAGTSPEHEIESIPENRTRGQSPTLDVDVSVADGEPLSRNDDTPELPSSQDHRKDLPRLACAEIATSHSIESHRTVPALETNPAYIASGQTSDRTGDMSTLLGLFDSVEHKHENSILPVGSNVHPSAQKSQRSARKSSLAQSICTCVPVSTDHFATFPPDLVEPCIKAGCPMGGTVLDPFGGSGTVGLVADRLQRDAVLIELNPKYVAMAERRVAGDAPLFVWADNRIDGDRLGGNEQLPQREQLLV